MVLWPSPSGPVSPWPIIFVLWFVSFFPLGHQPVGGVNFSCTPSIQCSSCQNLDVNFESWSDTIEVGKLQSLMTSQINMNASSRAFEVVLIRIRWTVDV